jgi:UDP-3-O-[3-hydroxymyristoyl] glucosamine N-acyltransferase
VIGDGVQFGGQVGVGGHLTIGDRVKAVGQTGITNSVDADEFISGYPAIANSEWRRSSVVFRKLPEMRKQLRALEERLRAVEEIKKKE